MNVLYGLSDDDDDDDDDVAPSSRGMLMANMDLKLGWFSTRFGHFHAGALTLLQLTSSAQGGGLVEYIRDHEKNLETNKKMDRNDEKMWR